MKHSLKIVVGMGVILLGTICWCPGAVRTWTGSGADSFWNSPANFGGSTPLNNDQIVFSTAVRQVNTNNITALTTDSILFTTSGWSLYGNGIICNNGITNTASSGTVTINPDITFGNNQTFTNGAGALIFAGAIDVNGKTFTLNNAGTLTLSGPVVGAGTLTKNAVGTLVLFGTNSFTGDVILNVGVIQGTRPSPLRLGPPRK